MSDSSSTRRDKRGWFRRSRPIDVSELMKDPGAPAVSRAGSPAGTAEGRAPKRSADMFRTIENGDAWSSSAWAEDGWDDDWSDPSSKRASVRPAADPRPEDVDAWLESGSSDFADVTRDIAERWVGRAGRGPVKRNDSGTAPPPPAVDPRRTGLSLDTLRSSTPVELPDHAAPGAADAADTAMPDDFDPIADLEDATRFHAPTPAADDRGPAEIRLADPVVTPGTTWDDAVTADEPIECIPDVESEVRTEEGTGESTADAEADEITEELPADDLPADDLPADDLPADDLPADDLPADDLLNDDVVPADPAVESEFSTAAVATDPHPEAIELLHSDTFSDVATVPDSHRALDAPTVFPIAPDEAVEDDLLPASRNTELVFDDLDLDSDGDLDGGTGNSPVLSDPISAGRTDEVKESDDLARMEPIDDIDEAFARGPIAGRPDGHAPPAHIADDTDPSAGDFERLDDDDFDDDDFDGDLDNLDDLQFEDDLEADDEDDWDDVDERASAAPGTSPSTRVPALLPVDANALRPLRPAAASSTFCTTVGTGIVLVASVRMLLALASGIVTSEGAGAARVDVVNRIGAAFTGLGLFHGLALIVGAAFLVLPMLLGDDDARRHDSRAASMLGIAGGAAVAGIVGGLLGIRAGLHGIDASATDWTRIIGDAVAIAGSSLVALSAVVQAIRVRSTR